MRSSILIRPVGIYLLKVNNRNINKVWNMFKVDNKDRMTPGVVLVSLLLALNIFHTLL